MTSNPKQAWLRSLDRLQNILQRGALGTSPIKVGSKRSCWLNDEENAAVFGNPSKKGNKNDFSHFQRVRAYGVKTAQDDAQQAEQAEAEVHCIVTAVSLHCHGIVTASSLYCHCMLSALFQHVSTNCKA